MKRVLICCVMLALSIPVIALHFTVSIPAARQVSKRWGCNSRLGCIDCALSAYCYPPQHFYPASLKDLPNEDVCPSLFVCPWTDTRAGESMTNLDEWSELMYLGGLSPDSPPGIPVIVCPPINHKNLGGSVLYSEHWRGWVPSPEIDRVIDRMYAYAESNGLPLVVSAALTKRSNGRYKSVPARSVVSTNSVVPTS
jgi:hypothetical protein